MLYIDYKYRYRPLWVEFSSLLLHSHNSGECVLRCQHRAGSHLGLTAATARLRIERRCWQLQSVCASVDAGWRRSWLASCDPARSCRWPWTSDTSGVARGTVLALTERVLVEPILCRGRRAAETCSCVAHSQPCLRKMKCG